MQVTTIYYLFISQIAIIYNDVVRAIDNDNFLVLILRNLRVTFDTVSHAVLLEVLEHFGGFRSYLLDQTQSCIASEASALMQLASSVLLGLGIGQRNSCIHLGR